MKDEAMLEVGDAEVVLHQEEAHHHDEVPLQDVVEVLTTEVVPGGLDLVVEMIVARLGEGLRQGGVLPQGEAPHLAEVHLQGGAPHQEEDLLQGVMDLLVMMAPLTGAATAL